MRARTTTALFTLLLAPAFALTQQPQPAPAPASQGQAVSTHVRFSGRLPLHAPGKEPAAAVAPKIELRHVAIAERQRVVDAETAALAENKTLIICTLRAGDLTTTIDGKRTERRVGEYWTVRPGQRQTLETADDTAVIETIAVEQP